jgi:phospholipase/carboxylesterase
MNTANKSFTGFVKSAFNEEPAMPSSAILSEGSYPLPYLERLPKVKNDSTPLIIMLHGRAAKAETIFSVEGLLDPEFHIISIRGTYPSPKGEFEWFLPYDYEHPLESFSEEHFRESENILTEMIIRLLREKGFTDDRLFIMGFSQGAAMCYILSLRGNIKPRGTMAMSGFFPRPIMNWDSLPNSGRYLITHGTEDDVLPASESIFAQEFLASKGISSQYYSYKGRHKMTIPLLKHTNTWIKQQTP